MAHRSRPARRHFSCTGAVLRKLTTVLMVAAAFGLAATSSTAATAAQIHTVATAASTTSSPAKICVAVVLDATTLGGNVSTACAKVDRGATGIDVLEAAGHTMTFRSDGLLCTIDDEPASGCAAVDNTHYWAYYHRAPGARRWSYSNEGPATYQPANDSTEGWVYRDGTLVPPRNVPYSQICSEPQQTPTPHRSRRTSPPSTSLPRHLPTHSARPLPPRSTPTVTPHAKATIVPERRHHRSSTPPSYPVVTASPPKAISPTPASGPAGGGHGGLIGAIVAAAIVVALGGAAVVTNRRRRS